MNSTQILPFQYSEHDSIQLKVLQKQQRRGPGYWNINTSILKHENYQNAIKNFWQDSQEQKQNYNNITQWWEVGKLYLKMILFKHPKPKNQNSSTKSNQRNTIRKTKRNPEPKQDYRTS